MSKSPDLGALAEHLPDLVMLLDESLTLTWVNGVSERLLGWTPGEVVGRPVIEMVHPDDHAVVLSSGSTILDEEVGTAVEIRVAHADGSWRWVEFIGTNALDIDGVHSVVVVARDITGRRMWEVAQDDDQLFRHVVQHAAAVTLLLDEGGVVRSANGAFTRLLGHDLGRVVGRPLADFCAAGSGGPLAQVITQATAVEGQATVIEAPMLTSDGAAAPRPMRWEVVNLVDDPVVRGFIVTGHDVTELVETRTNLEHLATHDALTGLANRSVLLETLDDLVNRHSRAAVVFIDLDRFKPVNDLLGHEAGDELLRVVADRLRSVVRPGDLVARVGGDEFVIVSPGITERSAAQSLCDRIDATLSMPYLLTEGPVRVTASVGLALADDDATVTGLLADADLAMYEAKAGRRGEPERAVGQRQRSANERRRLADDLAAGLARGEVIAYLQPISRLDSGRTDAFEALVRWHHPRKGILSPAAFLDLAEDAGLELLLGDVVLRSACRTLRSLPAHVSVGVNLSVAQLADRGLCDRIGLILAEHDLPAHRLVVEITEHATLTRRPGGGRVSPEHTLEQLRAMGISLCLDDFGTGYSSLTHIRRYPLSAIKIDRSFVGGMIEHSEDHAVVAAMIGMADALGLDVVAEGVETVAQRDELTRLGCDLAQGYLVSPPLHPDEVERWFTRHGNDWRVGRDLDDTAPIT